VIEPQWMIFSGHAGRRRECIKILRILKKKIIMKRTPMNGILDKIAVSVEKGKVSADSPYPPELKGQKGADELTRKALGKGISPEEILTEGLIRGMMRVGEKFRKGEIYLPDVLISSKAVTEGMRHLKPHFLAGTVRRRGKVVLGTVEGDLHDIGKKILAMFLEGNGWEVIDCGVDVSADQFINTIEDHSPDAVGLSALLTTTMVNMENAVQKIKKRFPDLKVMVGGAPVTQNFSDRIGADATFPDPQGAVEFLHSRVFSG
jgi:5-methyltetrahydrofolate--homocysteine methyltransferase